MDQETASQTVTMLTHALVEVLKEKDFPEDKLRKLHELFQLLREAAYGEKN